MSALDELDEMARRTLVWRSLGRCDYCLRRDYEWNAGLDDARHVSAYPDAVAFLFGRAASFPEPPYLCPSCRATVRAWWAAFTPQVA